MSKENGICLTQSLELTRRLLALTKAEAWEEAAEVEAQRFALLRQGIAGQKAEELKNTVKLLKEMERLNLEILSLSRNCRSELGQRLRELHQGRKAGKAYR